MSNLLSVLFAAILATVSCIAVAADAVPDKAATPAPAPVTPVDAAPATQGVLPPGCAAGCAIMNCQPPSGASQCCNIATHTAC
jgi:hypothetical protein